MSLPHSKKSKTSNYYQTNLHLFVTATTVKNIDLHIIFIYVGIMFFLNFNI